MPPFHLLLLTQFKVCSLFASVLVPVTCLLTQHPSVALCTAGSHTFTATANTTRGGLPLPHHGGGGCLAHTNPQPCAHHQATSSTSSATAYYPNASCIAVADLVLPRASFPVKGQGPKAAFRRGAVSNSGSRPVPTSAPMDSASAVPATACEIELFRAKSQVPAASAVQEVLCIPSLASP